MTIDLQDRRVITALAAIFMLGLACVLLLGLAVLTLSAMLLSALVSTIAEIFSTIHTLYSSGGTLTHLVVLLGVLFAILYSFKKVRTLALRFFQRQFTHFSAFAQKQQTPPDSEGEREDRDYEEGEVIDLDAEEEKARTAANSPHTGSRHTTTTGRSRKQRKKQKRSRHAATARAVLALTHA